MGRGVVYAVTSGKGRKNNYNSKYKYRTCKFQVKVAVIDADIGLRNLDVVMGLENRVVYDIVDVVEGRAKIKTGFNKR